MGFLDSVGGYLKDYAEQHERKVASGLRGMSDDEVLRVFMNSEYPGVRRLAEEELDRRGVGRY